MRRLLTTGEAAKVLEVSPATMRSWRHRGQGPVYRQPAGKGSGAIYDPEIIELFKLRQKEK